MIAIVIVAKAGVLVLSAWGVWLLLKFADEQPGQVRSDPKPGGLQATDEGALERYRKEVTR